MDTVTDKGIMNGALDVIAIKWHYNIVPILLMQFILVNSLSSFRESRRWGGRKGTRYAMGRFGRFDKNFLVPFSSSSSTPRTPVDYNNTFIYIIENPYTPLIFGCDVKS